VTIKRSLAALVLGTTSVVTDNKRIYVKRGKSISLKPYGLSKGSVDSEFPIYFPIAVKDIKWTSSNKKVATVSKSGKVKVIKKAKIGKYATIKAKVGGKSASYRVYAIKKVGKVTDLTHATNKLFDSPVGNTNRLPYNVDVKGTPNGKVTWSSSDKTVISIDAYGFFKVLKPGVAKLTINSGSEKITYTVNALSLKDYLNKYYDNYDD
jgi:uncharacterized protein YjdB